MKRQDFNPAQIFLCHSHRDKRFVRRLAEDLIELSIRVWLDEWELEVGDSLHECIGAALSESAYVGVVLSPDSVNSRWCRSELDQALTREKRSDSKVVLPLLYRKVEIPAFLEGRLYLHFSRSYYKSLTELVALLNGLEIGPVRRALSKARPRNTSDVKLILSEDTRSFFSRVDLDPREYRKLMKDLSRVGIEVDEDSFELSHPRTKRTYVVMDSYESLGAESAERLFNQWATLLKQNRRKRKK